MVQHGGERVAHLRAGQADPDAGARALVEGQVIRQPRTREIGLVRAAELGRIAVRGGMQQDQSWSFLTSTPPRTQSLFASLKRYITEP